MLLLCSSPLSGLSLAQAISDLSLPPPRQEPSSSKDTYSHVPCIVSAIRSRASIDDSPRSTEATVVRIRSRGHGEGAHARRRDA